MGQEGSGVNKARASIGLGRSAGIIACQVGRGEFGGPPVALNVGGIALAGWTVAACARRLDDYYLVRPKLHAARLWR